MTRNRKQEGSSEAAVPYSQEVQLITPHDTLGTEAREQEGISMCITFWKWMRRSHISIARRTLMRECGRLYQAHHVTKPGFLLASRWVKRCLWGSVAEMPLYSWWHATYHELGHGCQLQGVHHLWPHGIWCTPALTDADCPSSSLSHQIMSLQTATN